MKILSIIGIVFIPLSTVSSIFGTEFFTAIVPSTEPASKDELKQGYIYVNPQLWILVAIALPLTLIILTFWLVWERQSVVGVPHGVWTLKGRLLRPSPPEPQPSPSA